MFYEEIRTKQDLSDISICSLSILYNLKFILMATSLGTNTVFVTRITGFPKHQKQNKWSTRMKRYKSIQPTHKEELEQSSHLGMTSRKATQGADSEGIHGVVKHPLTQNVIFMGNVG